MPMIHNRGRKIGEKTTARKIVFPKAWDENGQPVREGKNVVTETLNPGEHKKVSDEQFAHLKKIFGSEIVNIDDMQDMQDQFKETAAPAKHTGYIAPEDFESEVAKRVAEELSKKGVASEDKLGKEETREELIARIDKMDRGDLISLIEEKELGIEYKNYKNPAALKAAILESIEAKDPKIAA